MAQSLTKPSALN